MLQVELLGYASGDDHLYLVYEYIRNGSLSDHLHDPLLKGIQITSMPALTFQRDSYMFNLVKFKAIREKGWINSYIQKCKNVFQ